MLAQGSREFAVQSLQEMLKEMGYFHGQITREYDIETVRAVINFQKHSCLYCTGIADEQTRILIAVKSAFVKTARDLGTAKK